MKLPIHRTLAARLTGLFALLLMLFTLLLGLIFNAMMERKMVAHYSRTMQRDAYAISQNLSEMIAPSDYETLDENPFIVGEDTLAPYMGAHRAHHQLQRLSHRRAAPCHGLF